MSPSSSGCKKTDSCHYDFSGLPSNHRVIAGQTMVWAIFHLLPINKKFQWAILSKFNIAISVVNGPFLLLNGSMAHGPTPAIPLSKVGLADMPCYTQDDGHFTHNACTHAGMVFRNHTLTLFSYIYGLFPKLFCTGIQLNISSQYYHNTMTTS